MFVSNSGVKNNKIDFLGRTRPIIEHHVGKDGKEFVPLKPVFVIGDQYQFQGFEEKLLCCVGNNQMEIDLFTNIADVPNGHIVTVVNTRKVSVDVFLDLEQVCEINQQEAIQLIYVDGSWIILNPKHKYESKVDIPVNGYVTDNF